MSDQGRGGDANYETDPPRNGRPGTYNPVVFSRKDTNNAPDGEYADDGQQQEAQPPAGLSSLVHQTDRNGNQQAIPPAPNSPHAIRGNNSRDGEEDEAGQDSNCLFSKLCCCLYLGNDPMPGANYPDSRADPDTRGRRKILPPMLPMDQGKKCLVLDLDETLVHSSFKPTQNPDYIIPVDIEGTTHRVYVCKRPGVDEFMRTMGKLFEIVVYTASLSKYANPLLDRLDEHNVIRYRLFREHCVHHEGSYVKDLSLLDRDLNHCVIIDNSPLSYMFHPKNAIGCGTFIDDLRDRELPVIADFLREIEHAKDVREHMQRYPDYLIQSGAFAS